MIAEELGVSTATVDRVLNNRKGVSEKTIRRVKRKAEELGYKPNTAAKFLATQKKTNVAFILPIVPNYFWDEMESEIKKAAQVYENFGFEVHVFRVDTIPKEKQILFLQNIIDHNTYDAIVISPHDSDPYTDVINEGVRKGIPIFTLNNDVPLSNRISFVGGDYYRAGFLAAELVHLFSKELKDVVIIREDEDTFQMINKEKGFRAYFQMNEIDVNIHTLPVKSDNIQLDKEWKRVALKYSNAIYVANGILGDIAEHIHEEKYEDYKILIGHDMSEKINKYLQQKIIKSTICQDPSSQAMITVKNVYNYLLLGERSEILETIIKLEIVTPSNASYYIHQ
nr:LacI family DNA-binding transcriptional regulator [Lederbergia lenta]